MIAADIISSPEIIYRGYEGVPYSSEFKIGIPQVLGIVLSLIYLKW